MPGFKINIGANTIQLTKALGELQKDLAGFKKQLQTATNAQEVIKLNQAIAQTDKQIKSISGAKNIDALGVSLKTIAPGSNQATNALTNLSRIAQDAPFGFIGITNNINPLLESFQRLKAETGSSGLALKALGGSLLGAGGLGLAVGVGSALLTVFGEKLFGLGAAAKKAKNDTEELKKTIRDIGEVQAEATGGVQGQVAQVNALADAVSDSNKPYAERKRALEELKDINKAYFGDLKLEDAATGALAKTVDQYTKALVASAIVKSFVNEIAEVAKAAAKADTELAKATTRVANAEKGLASARANRPTFGGGREGTAETNAEADANNKLIEAVKERRLQGEKVTDLLTQQVILQNELNKAQGEALKFKDIDTKGSEKEVDLLKKRLAELEKIKDATKDIFTITDLEEQIFDLKVKITLRDAAKNGLSKEETDLAIQGFRNQLTEAFNREVLALEAIPKVKVTSVEVAELPSGAIESAVAKATGLDKKIPEITIREARIKFIGLQAVLTAEQKEALLKQLQSDFDSVLSGIQTNAIGGLAESIGEALVGATKGGNLFEALFTIIAEGAQQLGKALIAYGVALIGFKLALKSIKPFAAIAAGVGLIVAGAALKGSIPKFAEGGIATRPTLGIFGEQGPEAVIPLARLPQIMGQQSGGGGINGEFRARIVDGGRDLILIMNQANKSFNRNF